MMDANDDWTEKGSKTFQAFISDLYLIDPLHENTVHNYKPPIPEDIAD